LRKADGYLEHFFPWLKSRTILERRRSQHLRSLPADEDFSAPIDVPRAQCGGWRFGG
jgi:hypothetical protein